MDQKAATHLLEQSFQLWFNPEVERRRSSGLLPPNYTVWAGQVIMDLELEKPLVRLNEEVRAMVHGKAARPVSAGEAIALDTDLLSIDRITLTNEFPNAGHLTALIFKGSWIISFDFQHNAERIQTQLASADQFLSSARHCVQSNLPIAAIDNLYDAVQILAKCFLLAYPDKTALESKSHGFIETRLNLFGKRGAVSPASVRLLNELTQLRPKTRYALRPIEITAATLDRLLSSADNMRAEIERRRPKRFQPR
jgi:uncharacterized protein (UPF0332 family)